MKLVLNTSPPIFLTKLDALTTLGGCFAEILVPPGSAGRGRHRSARVHQAHGTVRTRRSLRPGFHRWAESGRLGGDVLARETGAGLVALDDLRARRKASRLGLRPIGTVGLILLTQRRGLIDAATAAARIEALVDTHGLYLSREILNQVRADLAPCR